VGPHVVGLSALSFFYIIWAYIGYIVTDQYAYFFLDHKKIGWEYVSGAIISFVVLGDICKCSSRPCDFVDLLTLEVFAFVYGITGVRENWTKKSDDKQSGYTRLPQ
jgi:hypothetical protein